MSKNPRSPENISREYQTRLRAAAILADEWFSREALLDLLWKEAGIRPEQILPEGCRESARGIMLWAFLQGEDSPARAAIVCLKHRFIQKTGIGIGIVLNAYRGDPLDSPLEYFFKGKQGKEYAPPPGGEDLLEQDEPVYNATSNAEAHTLAAELNSALGKSRRHPSGLFRGIKLAPELENLPIFVALRDRVIISDEFPCDVRRSIRNRLEESVSWQGILQEGRNPTARGSLSKY